MWGQASIPRIIFRGTTASWELQAPLRATARHGHLRSQPSSARSRHFRASTRLKTDGASASRTLENTEPSKGLQDLKISFFGSWSENHGLYRQPVWGWLALPKPAAKLLDQQGSGKNGAWGGGHQLIWLVLELWITVTHFFRNGSQFRIVLDSFQLLQPFLQGTTIKRLLEHLRRVTCDLTTWLFACLLCPVKCIRKMPELPSKSP